MPFVLLFIGLVAILVGVRGHGKDAGDLLAKEFTGSNSFIQWFLAIMILGLIGYYKPAKPVADGMIGLLIVAMIISKKGLFANLESAFQNAQPIAANTGKPVTTAQTPGVASPYASQAPFTPGNISVYNPNMFDPTAPNFVGAF